VNDFDVESTNATLVVGLSDLPAGSYEIISTLANDHTTSGFDETDAFCRLMKGGVDLSGASESFVRTEAGLTLSMVATVNGSDTVGAYCQTDGSPTEIHANIVAIALNQLN
jgi:hypothetical protein